MAFKECGGAAGGDDRKAMIYKHLGGFDQHGGVLSASLIEKNTFPPLGRSVPAPICALRKASGKERSQPMTSPVERISGPRMVSTPGKRAKGRHRLFHRKPGHVGIGPASSGRRSDSVPGAWHRRDSLRRSGKFDIGSPAIRRAAMEAMAESVALATKGTVREARGLTSIRKISSSLMANCTFIRPT